jgi:hypothetical protein
MAGRRDTRAPGLLRRARQQRRGERLPHPGNPALAHGAAAPQPANPDQLGQDEPHRDPVDTPDPHRASIPASALRRHAPKVGAQCGNSARWDLCGGPPARAVPTATALGPSHIMRCHVCRQRLWRSSFQLSLFASGRRNTGRLRVVRDRAGWAVCGAQYISGSCSGHAWNGKPVPCTTAFLRPRRRWLQYLINIWPGQHWYRPPPVSAKAPG